MIEYDVGNVSFSEYGENETYASEETISSDHTIVEQESPGLDTFETFAVICTLEKCINQLNILGILDEVESGNMLHDAVHDLQMFDSRDQAAKTAKLREFVSQTLAQTVQELRTSNTFTALQRLNDSMLKIVDDEQKLERERISNKTALIDLRSKEKRYRQQHSVSIHLIVYNKTYYASHISPRGEWEGL